MSATKKHQKSSSIPTFSQISTALKSNSQDKRKESEGSDMPPKSPGCNGIDAAFADAETRRQRWDALPLGIKMANRFSSLARKFRHPVAFATIIWGALAALVDAILRIVPGITEEQVIGPHARGIVAMMADQQSGGNWPVVKLPRKPMSRNLFVREGEMSIAVPSRPLEAASPKPARLSFLNKLPEPFHRIASALGHAVIAGLAAIHPSRCRERNEGEIAL